MGGGALFTPGKVIPGKISTDNPKKMGSERLDLYHPIW